MSDQQPPAPPSLQAVSLPCVVGTVSRLKDGSASVRCVSTLEFSVDELVPLYRLQQQHCNLLLQPDGMRKLPGVDDVVGLLVAEPEGKPHPKPKATPSQIVRMLIERIWEAGWDDNASTSKEDYYERRMLQIINRLQAELDQLQK